MTFIVKDLSEAYELLIEAKDHGNTVLGKEKCLVCQNAIKMSIKVIPFKVFNCGHFYHSSCIESYENKCIKCSSEDIEIKEKETKKGRAGKNANKDSANNSFTDGKMTPTK